MGSGHRFGRSGVCDDVTLATAPADFALVQRALAGDDAARAELVRLLAPRIQFKVNAALVRRGQPRREDVLDLVQEVFLALFEDDAKVLRSWDPKKGAGLRSFVGLVAERAAAGYLRSGKKSGWREHAAEASTLERAAGAEQGFEARVADRQTLERLLDRLRATLDPRGMQLFRALFVEGRGGAEVGAELGMSTDAVYAWRSRLRRQIRGFASASEAPARKAR